MNEVKLVITLKNGQQPTIEGPLHNKVLCYGLLGVAWKMVDDYKPQKVEVAEGPVVGQLLKNG